MFLAVLFALALTAQAIDFRAGVALALILFIAGLAHGAADEGDGEIMRPSLIMTGGYILVALAVASVFIAAPLAGLTLFLALSTWHFAEDFRADRIAVALLTVGGSALFRTEATGATFALLLSSEMPAFYMTVLAGFGALGLVFMAWATVRQDCGWIGPLLAIAATWLLEPALAVGFIFFALHALPQHMRQFSEHGAQPVLYAMLPTSTIAAIGAIGTIAAVAVGFVPITLAAALGFGLATPHMLADRLS